MIRVDPTAVEMPVIFTDTGKGPVETAEAVAFYGLQANLGKSFKFKVYSDKAVKEALARLFRGKCAYCESRFDATQPVDVEHWRPKGDVEDEVEGKLGRGYYWLAATWDNLLPACIDCNRKREHLIQPTNEKRVIGKGNYFPLRTGTARANTPGKETEEQPLLLHPYRDDPTLALDLDEHEGVLLPKNEQGVPDARGEASIRVYALNRTGLVHARREVLHLMEQHIYVIRQLAILLSSGLKPELHELVADLIAYEMDRLRDFAEPHRPYSFAAQRRIQRFEAELGL
jgi:5-methylcytosine-specific restriction endonuclease McrA